MAKETYITGMANLLYVRGDTKEKMVYAISRNGTEPARNIPQDAKTRNDHFYN